MKNLDKIETLLRSRLGKLQEKIEDIDDELDLPGDDDFAEMAQESQNDEVLEGIGLAASDEINQIELALKRIADGTYGECTECGLAIAQKRLEAVPHTAFCIECETEIEKKSI